MTCTTLFAGVAAAAALAFGGMAQAAGSAAYEFNSATTSLDRQLSLGFDFTTTRALTINALGYFDLGGDGFATAHQVGIFDAGGNLLASASLGSGTTDPLSGHFRYADIAPFSVASGTTLRIAATTGGPFDPWLYGDGGSIAGLTIDSAINIPANAARFLYQGDDVLRFPTDHFSNYMIYGGPDFRIAGTPEPGAWAFMILGFGGIGAIARRRRRQRVATA